MERILMRMEVLRGETLGEPNKAFRFKVQLGEQIAENEMTIQFKRGFMTAFEKFDEVLREVANAEKLEKAQEDMRKRRAEGKPEAQPHTDSTIGQGLPIPGMVSA